MTLFVISCKFKTWERGKVFSGLAVCKDPDTPVQLLFEDGRPVMREPYWYELEHHRPWARFDLHD